MPPAGSGRVASDRIRARTDSPGVRAASSPVSSPGRAARP
ncbi:hypothetical protein YT1_2810 [Rhodococcus ruber]|nr:hypothetical protein YT1_2810 [Rhodococcus ruber]